MTGIFKTAILDKCNNNHSKAVVKTQRDIVYPFPRVLIVTTNTYEKI